MFWEAGPNATDRTIDDQSGGRDHARSGAAARRRGPGASRPVADCRTCSATCRPEARRHGASAAGDDHRQRAAALERRGRRLRPSLDDRERDPRGGGEFRSVRGFDVARCRTPPHLARQFPALHRRTHARSADHGPGGLAAGIHQVDLGLSRHPGERQPARQGPRGAGDLQGAVRRDGKSLWRRPLCDRVDLGHRIELFDA